MRLKQQNGNITVEATISLTTFLFAFVMLFSYVNVCIAQAKISTAISATAKEISQYTYLYSLTGLNESNAKLSEAAQGTKDKINDAAVNVNTIFNSAQSIGETGKQTNISDPKSIMDSWETISKDVKDVKSSTAELQAKIEEAAKDPKALIFGIGKLAASEGFEVAKSKLIAQPITKALIQKHLTNGAYDTPDKYLKSLGIVPKEKGNPNSYFNAIDFSQSTLFPYGSNEIKIVAVYKVRLLQLIPIDFDFTFVQTAVTKGWFAGDKENNDISQKEEEAAKEAKTIWDAENTNERAELIRNLTIKDMVKLGYMQTKGFTTIQLYNPNNGEFMVTSSLNPYFYSSQAQLKDRLDTLATKIKSETNGITEVRVKDSTGKEAKYNVTEKNLKIVISIPEDSDNSSLGDLSKLLTDGKYNGVTIEFVKGFGNGDPNRTIGGQ